MLPTARQLQKLAGETGFQVVGLEKIIRLAELLDAIGNHPELGDFLVLKGGTALNLFFGPPQRLSVDLDFNFVGAREATQMAELRPALERALEAVTRSQGYGIQESAQAHAGKRLFLSYQRLVDGARDRAQIDVNFLHRISLYPAEQRQIWRPDEEGGLVVLASWVEIAAGKLVALLARATPRDAWDVARLPEISPTPWPDPRLRAVFIALAGTLPLPLYQYGHASLERIADSDVSRLLHPMLIQGERPSAAILKSKAWDVVAPFLTLTEAEHAYCERLQAGSLAPELLFPDDRNLAERVRQYPALLWKAKNALEHAKRSARKDANGP